MQFYSIKTIPEDFHVVEVSFLPDFIDKENASYTYVWMKKKSNTTFEALDKIINYFSLPYNSIGSEGLKDENAITEQMLSIQKILDDNDLLAFNKKNQQGETFIEFVRIIGYGTLALQARKLHGNIFTIVLRNLTQKHANQLRDFSTSNRFVTLVNY